MSESKRVLSGSLTKGSSASQETEMIPFYQGINVSDVRRISDRLSPHMRSGDTFGIFKGGTRMRDAQFDDTITLNNELTDLREDDDRFEQRLVFDMEKANFGVAPTIPMGEPFADLIDFDPVVYLQDEGTFMYPSSLWNLGELPKHEFDGIAEVFDKRKNILGLVDLRYEGRTSRGSLTGGASERPWGSIEISDSWKTIDKQVHPFLDAPLFISESAGATESYIYEGISYLTSSFTAGAYSYSQAAAATLELWGELDSTPDDRSSRDVTMAAYGTLDTHYRITSETVGGDKTKSVWNWKASGTGTQPAPTTIPAMDFGAPSYWDTKIGLGSARTTDAYPTAPGISEFTVAIWVKLTSHQTTGETSTYTLMSMGQPACVDSQRPSFLLEMTNGNSTTGDTRPDGYARRPRIQLTSADPTDPTGAGDGQNTSTYWVPQTWNVWHDNNWHHLAATVIVVQGNLNSSGPTNESFVQFYIDGVAVNTLNAYNAWTAYGAKNQFILNDSVTMGSTTKTGKCRLFHDQVGSDVHKGAAAEPAIWSSILTADEIRAVYEMQKNRHVQQTIYDHHNNPLTELNPLHLQPFMDIGHAADDPMIELDYHDRVYFSLTSHNNSDMRNALRLLNSSSCNNITDPLKKQASTGLCDSRAGSITFGDVYVTGEYE